MRVTASNKQGSTTSTSTATSVVTTEGGKSANSAPPTISGSAIVGSTLTGSTGIWVGDGPITYSYSWLHCDSDGNACKAIGGKTQKTYKVVQADVGKRLHIRVIASNSRGKSDAFSLPTDITQDAGGGGGIIDLPNGEKSVDAKDVPKDQRLIVNQVKVRPEPGHVAEPADLHQHQGHRHTRLRRAQRDRLHPIDSEAHERRRQRVHLRGRVDHVLAPAVVGLPAPQRVQRAVLREGVSQG